MPIESIERRLSTSNTTEKHHCSSVWTSHEFFDHTGKYIYVLVDNGVMNCLEADTGKVVYQGQRVELGTYSSSPLLADGKVYCINEEGTTTVVKAGPSFEVLGVNKLDSRTLASPVAVDNQIFIRTADYLYCIQKC